jgi:hypothetical protein
MKWFRLYNEVYSDPKVQGLRPELFRFWVNVMCIASESDPRGIVPSEAKLKRLLNLSGPAVKRYLSDLVGAALLCLESVERRPEKRRGDGDSLMPHCWDERQPEGDDAAKCKRDSVAKTSVQSAEMPEDQVSRDKNVTSPPRVRKTDRDSDREFDRQTTPPNPSGRGGVCAVVLPMVEADPAADAVWAVAEWAEGLRPGTGIGRWATDMAKVPYDPAWIREAIEIGLSQQNLNFRFLAGILRRMAADGGPRKPQPFSPSFGVGSERPLSRTAERNQKREALKASLGSGEEESASG